MKRKKVEIDRLRSKLEVVANQYDRQLIELDIEEYELDVSKFQVTLHQYDNELQPFLDWINERYGSIEELKKVQNIMKKKSESIGLLGWVNKQQWMFTAQDALALVI